MYKGINLTINEATTHKLLSVDKLNLSSEREAIKKKSSIIRESLEQHLLSDSILDGESLKKEWFPEIEDIDIFLSHSHQDKSLALDIAAILKSKFDLNVFIDSQVWGYADKLLKTIDERFALNDDKKTYNYTIRNKTTSNIYLILNSALQAMIDKAECLIFINTDNTINELQIEGNFQDRTSSPWIMSELQFSKLVRKVAKRAKNEIATESISESLTRKSEASFEVSYKAELSHLHSMSSKSFACWVNNSIRKDLFSTDVLDYLYSIIQDESILKRDKMATTLASW